MSAVEDMPSGEPVSQELSGQGSNFRDAFVDFMGGVVGGVAATLVGQPLDTVKVKVQTFPSLYTNSLDCFIKTLRNEGFVNGLYAGTLPSMVAKIADFSVVFLAYGQIRKGVAKVQGKQDVSALTPLENALSGGSAAFFSSLALCPTELIKCKLQAQEQVLKSSSQASNIIRMGPFSLTRHILQTEGIAGFYRGLVPTFAREMPGYCFFFGGYETCRYLFTPEGGNKDDIGALATMFSGAMGGVALWTAVFPADVIKSRSQVLATSAAEQNMNMLQIFNLIRQEEGVRGLYRGLGPTLLRTMPATAALFLSYETIKKTFASKNS